MTNIEFSDKNITIIGNNLFIITRKLYDDLDNKRRYWENKYKKLKSQKQEKKQ